MSFQDDAPTVQLMESSFVMALRRGETEPQDDSLIVAKLDSIKRCMRNKTLLYDQEFAKRVAKIKALKLLLMRRLQLQVEARGERLLSEAEYGPSTGLQQHQLAQLFRVVREPRNAAQLLTGTDYDANCLAKDLATYFFSDCYNPLKSQQRLLLTVQLVAEAQLRKGIFLNPRKSNGKVFLEQLLSSLRSRRAAAQIKKYLTTELKRLPQLLKVNFADLYEQQLNLKEPSCTLQHIDTSEVQPQLEEQIARESRELSKLILSLEIGEVQQQSLRQASLVLRHNYFTIYSIVRRFLTLLVQTSRSVPLPVRAVLCCISSCLKRELVGEQTRRSVLVNYLVIWLSSEVDSGDQPSFDQNLNIILSLVNRVLRGEEFKGNEQYVPLNFIIRHLRTTAELLLSKLSQHLVVEEPLEPYQFTVEALSLKTIAFLKERSGEFKFLAPFRKGPGQKFTGDNSVVAGLTISANLEESLTERLQVLDLAKSQSSKQYKLKTTVISFLAKLKQLRETSVSLKFKNVKQALEANRTRLQKEGSRQSRRQTMVSFYLQILFERHAKDLDLIQLLTEVENELIKNSALLEDEAVAINQCLSSASEVVEYQLGCLTRIQRQHNRERASAALDKMGAESLGLYYSLEDKKVSHPRMSLVGNYIQIRGIRQFVSKVLAPYFSTISEGEEFVQMVRNVLANYHQHLEEKLEGDTLMQECARDQVGEWLLLALNWEKRNYPFDRAFSQLLLKFSFKGEPRKLQLQKATLTQIVTEYFRTYQRGTNQAALLDLLRTALVEMKQIAALAGKGEELTADAELDLVLEALSLAKPTRLVSHLVLLRTFSDQRHKNNEYEHGLTLLQAAVQYVRQHTE